MCFFKIYGGRNNKMLVMKLINGNYGVCRLDKDDKIPEWAYEGGLFSITKTEEELSILCLQESIPTGVKFEGDWRILKIEGPLDFSLVGILSKISGILALHNISIFAISTYDTDYILVKENNINTAVKALRGQGYEIRV
jgi:uncharacterized protein